MVQKKKKKNIITTRKGYNDCYFQQTKEKKIKVISLYMKKRSILINMGITNKKKKERSDIKCIN